MPTSHEFGRTPEGLEAHAFLLESRAARVAVTDFGATLLSMSWPDASGRWADALLGFGSLEGYLDDPACYGATIGPVANRTDRAEVPLGGTTWRLEGNDGPGLRNNLHSSLTRGLHKRVWQVVGQSDAPASLSLACELADGELGLPGNRRLTCALELADEGDGARLTVAYGCETDRPTFASMTNHSYFNLAGHDSGSAMAQRVRVEADAYLPVREDSVSRGDVVDVAGTPFDFREAKPLGRDVDADDEQLRIARGYDHCLLVRGWEPDAAPRRALEAVDDASGRTLRIDVTAPGAHLYTGNWLDDHDAKDGATYGPRCGFAFEPEFRPDCAHHPDWEQPVCEPGRPWRSVIVYPLGARRAGGAGRRA